MDDEAIIRALEKELTDIERRASRDEKEVDIIESKEIHKADLKQKNKAGEEKSICIKEKKITSTIKQSI